MVHELANQLINSSLSIQQSNACEPVAEWAAASCWCLSLLFLLKWRPSGAKSWREGASAAAAAAAAAVVVVVVVVMICR